MKVLFTIILLSVCLSSCQNKPAGKVEASTQEERHGRNVQEKDKGFPLPEIPSVITSPMERKAFLTAHYWDAFDFADTALVADRAVTERAFANHLAIMATPDTKPEDIAAGMDNLCGGMERHAHARKVFMQMADDYLYNPNSPYYNEMLYSAYLGRMLESTALDEAVKSTLKFKLELVCRNNPGSKATDFVYFTPDGQRRTLHCTKADGERVLLLFYDPECHTCHEVMEEMTSDGALADAVARKTVAVLAIYTEGSEEVWRKAQGGLPKGWLGGCDRQMVKDRALYDLKAMPSIYLLERDKTVILKDAPYTAVRRALGF